MEIDRKVEEESQNSNNRDKGIEGEVKVKEREILE